MLYLERNMVLCPNTVSMQWTTLKPISSLVREGLFKSILFFFLLVQTGLGDLSARDLKDFAEMISDQTVYFN